jgi:SAM-dependent methyltransferase
LPSADPRWWLRLNREVSSCPACESPRITLLDVLSIPKSPDGNRVAFLTGCHVCGLLFANPLPRQDELDRDYSPDGAWAARRAERMRSLEAAEARSLQSGKRRRKVAIPDRSRRLFDALAPHVPVYEPPSGAKMLDFGCGDGKFLNRFQDLGWETYGIELSTSVAFFRHRRLTSPPQDATFEFAFLNHVLEHLSAPLALLSQLAHALREGGVLFVSVPRIDTLPVHGDLDYCISGRRHVTCFSEECLRGLLARAGFMTVARLDAQDLDEVFTDGKPLRLRLVAVRAANSEPLPLPSDPLAPALDALAGYIKGREDLAARVQRLLPVRVRAGLLDRASARRAMERHRARKGTSGHQEVGGR